MSVAGRKRCLGVLLASMLLFGCAIAGRAAAAESPSFSMLPDTLAAGAPAGYTLNLSIPSGGGAGVKQLSVTLPQGVVISPAAGAGLGTCSKEQFAFGSGEAATCPPDSQVGTALLEASAHSEPRQGQVFLGEPECGVGGLCTSSDAQSGRMVRLFVQVQGAGEPAGAIKLEGIGEINQQTGQLTISFEQLPPVPFVDLKLSLNGGPHALLANPRTCGQASSNLTLVPAGASSTPEFLASEFSVSEGCIAQQFHPTAAVSAASSQALGYDPLTLAFARADADEYISAIQTTLAEGLLPNISSVPLCGEAQAGAGTCPAGSLIGHVAVQMGPGAEPASVEGGQVFFTGPYRGAPFGLSIVIPARVGPYTLAGTNGAGGIVVRAAVNVNPGTAVLTVTSDPGVGGIPIILDGIPLQLRLIQMTLDRPDFMTNPSSLRSAADHEHAGERSKRHCVHRLAVPGEQLRRVHVRPHIRGVHPRENVEDRRHEPVREDHRPVHRYRRLEGQGGTSQEALRPSEHVAEGVQRRDVRSEPGSVSLRLRRRRRPHEHAAGRGHLHRPGVLRLIRQLEVPGTGGRPAERRCEDRSARRNVHQQSRNHELHVRGDPRRVRELLRNNPAGRTGFRALRSRQPLPGPAADPQ